MFRKFVGLGLIILLVAGLFGGFGSRSRAAYYEGYADGLQAQAGESTEEGATAAPAPAPYRDGPGFFGWGALGILGIFAFFFKIAFFFFLAMLFMRLIFGRRWKHRGGPDGYGRWGHGPWGHHKHGRHKHGHHGPGPEKGPKWMNDDDDEPVMTV